VDAAIAVDSPAVTIRMPETWGGGFMLIRFADGVFDRISPSE